MTDKTLLQEARDALKELFDAKRPIYHDCLDDGLPECEWCLAEKMITRLDAELAKVVEPVVLDLSACLRRLAGSMSRNDSVDEWFYRQPDLLAAIRAQLPGVEVRV